jgi:hypothetical protein
MRPLSFLKRRAGALVLAFVSLYSLFYAVAFVQIYFKEHPYRLASEWFYKNAPQRSKIVAPHWDDKVPLSIPGHSASVFIMEGRDNELAVYERDIPSNIDQLAKKISSADFISFATPRTPDSIPRVPYEYPNTTALLRLLWGEKLGFKLAHTSKNRPSLFGIEFNDDLADESFSVYDHPKVTVFQNVERLSKEEILSRIANVENFEPLPSMDEMLLMDRGGFTPAKRFWDPRWSYLIGTFIGLLVLGLCVWAALGDVFSFLPDKGLGLSPLFGVGVASLAAWGLAILGIVPLSRSGAVFVVLILAVLALARVLLSARVRRRVAEGLCGHGFNFTVLCIGSALVLGAMIASDPSFFGIGARVEQSYLSYLARSQDPRPWDLFRPGERLPASFADRFALGWFMRLVDTPQHLLVPAGLLVAAVALGAGIYTLIRLLVRSSILSLVLSLVLLAPTLYGIRGIRDSKNQILANALAESARATPKQELSKWVDSKITGTPLVVEACDSDSLKGLVASIGLPTYSERGSGGIGGEKLCAVIEAETAYRRMIELGLELFLTPVAGDSLEAEQRSKSRIANFSARPDLFRKVYEDDSVAIYAPAFSRYYA